MKRQVEGQLTLFQGDFPVSLFPQPGSKEARRMTAISGQRWLGLSRNCGPLGSLEKMLLESCEWHSPTFYLNWKPVDIGQGHFLYQLALSEPDIEDTESQSLDAEPDIWKTPIASDAANREMYVNSRGEPNLSGQVKMWPTPKATPRGDCRAERVRRSPDPAAAVKMYNTPTAQDAKNSTLPQSQISRRSLIGNIMKDIFPTPTTTRPHDTEKTAGKYIKSQRQKDLAAVVAPTGQLNPDWVEWLMGFPIGWTDIGTQSQQMSQE